MNLRTAVPEAGHVVFPLVVEIFFDQISPHGGRAHEMRYPVFRYQLEVSFGKNLCRVTTVAPA